MLLYTRIRGEVDASHILRLQQQGHAIKSRLNDMSEMNNEDIVDHIREMATSMQHLHVGLNRRLCDIVSMVLHLRRQTRDIGMDNMAWQKYYNERIKIPFSYSRILAITPIVKYALSFLHSNVSFRLATVYPRLLYCTTSFFEMLGMAEKLAKLIEASTDEMLFWQTTSFNEDTTPNNEITVTTILGDTFMSTADPQAGVSFPVATAVSNFNPEEHKIEPPDASAVSDAIDEDSALQQLAYIDPSTAGSSIAPQ
jgi:hypothetical protein